MRRRPRKVRRLTPRPGRALIASLAVLVMFATAGASGWVLISSDVFGGRTSPLASLNYVTCHDGFTLADLVSYEHKRNESNLESNADGSDMNWSCGWGAGRRNVRSVPRRPGPAISFECGRWRPHIPHRA